MVRVFGKVCVLFGPYGARCSVIDGAAARELERNTLESCDMGNVGVGGVDHRFGRFINAAFKLQRLTIWAPGTFRTVI